MGRPTVAYLRPHDQLALPSGLDLIAAVGGDEGDQLPRALHLIASGAAQTLFTPRLGAVARSLADLVRLLDWLAAVGAELVAADVELDTATAEGQRAAALLREVERWDSDPDHPRRRRGRPGLTTDSPGLAERIIAMRERGLSLHAIADELNREGVPTPRGGSAWRASSVQSTLGYRRPHPPVPGAAPPAPPSAPRGPAGPPPGAPRAPGKRR